MKTQTSYTLPHSITILAVDRAESELVGAVETFISAHGPVNTVLLVNTAFAHTPAYKGDETGGLFTEWRVDFSDKNSLQKAIDALNKTEVILHCRMEEALKDVQHIRPLLHTKFIQSVSSLELATQKSKMRHAISSKYPETGPQHVTIPHLDAFSEESIQHLQFPVIVKPNGLHSSFLVTKCHTAAELYECLKASFEAIEEVHKNIYGTGEASFLIEEFIVGDMYSMDAYVNDSGDVFCLPLIRVITSAEVGKDGFYCYRSRTAHDLSDQDVTDAEACAQKAIAAIGLTNSSAHIELYHTASGWKIIEIAARIGGGRELLYKEAYGIDHFYNDLLIHWGKAPLVTPKWHRFASGFNIYADEEGTVEDIAGIETALQLPSTKRIGVNIAPGGLSVFASKGGDFVVDGNMSHDSLEQLDRDFETAIQAIQITVRSE
jgi:hypothetical protein